MPARQVGVVAVGDRQHLVERAVAAALSQSRRDHVVDDAIIEGVAGDTDARMAERFRAQRAAFSRETHHGEVAGAAAEIRDQHGGIAVQPAGEGEGRAHRLVDVARVTGAQALERRLIALHRQRLVGIAAGKAHGSADHDGRRLESERVSTMACQRPQESREKILEPVALPEDLGGIEAGAGGKGLERLDEAVDVASFKKLLDRPRATFSLGSAARPVFPEAQRRDIDAVPFSAVVEADGLDAAFVGRKGYDRIAGTEIDADREALDMNNLTDDWKGRAGAGTISGFAPSRQDLSPRLMIGPPVVPQQTLKPMSSSVRNPVPLVAHKCEVQAASSDVRLLKHTGRHLFERSSSDSDPSGR